MFTVDVQEIGGGGVAYVFYWHNDRGGISMYVCMCVCVCVCHLWELE